MARRRRRKGRIKGAALLLVMAAIAIGTPALALGWLRPALAEHAENVIQYRATTALEQAVSQAMEQQKAVSSLTSLESGETAALTTDSAAAESIRAQTVENAYDAINELEHESMSVPIGTLIDPQYLAGLGPRLHFNIVGFGMVSARVQSDFEDSGINQTKYCMSMQVKAEVQLHALWCSRSVTIENTYPLTETVIVGNVPNVNILGG